jgi:type I restriction enzyme, S subunit
MNKNVNAEGYKPGWKVLRFEQIATNINVRIDNPSESGMEYYVGLEHLDPDSLRIQRWGSPSDVEAGKLSFKTGDIIFAKRRAYQRKLGVAAFDGICSAHAMVLRAKSEVALPDFLPYFMQSDLFMNRAIEISVGSLSPTINWKTMAVQEFCIPPIDEQRKLIEVLSATRECADAYKSAEISLQTYLLSRTDELFSGPIDDGTTMQTIGNIAEVQYGLTINAKRRTIEKQLPYLRVANVQRFHIDLSEVKDVGVDGKDDGCILKRDDILVVEGHADINQLGRASIWEDQLPICLHQNHLIRIRCLPTADPYYVLEYVNSPAGRAYFRGRGKSTSGLNTLNSTVVREMTIPVPTLEMQKSIAKELREARQSLKGISERKEQHLAVSNRLSAKIFGGVPE